MPALNHSQKRPTKRGNAVERQEQKLKTFAENSTWTSSGENRLGQFDFERDDTKNNEKLEKNSYLDYPKYVNLREEVIAILKSGKSVEEKADLLVAVIGPSSNNDISSQNKIDFKAAAKVDQSPLPERPIRYADRKSYPEYAKMNAVEFLDALWGVQWKVNDVWTITQIQINAFDQTLLSNASAHCRRNNLDRSVVLPPAGVTRRPQSVPSDFVKGTPEHKLAVIRERSRQAMARLRLERQ